MSLTFPDIITAVALWGPLVAALAVAAKVASQRSTELKERMGMPAWDFSRSWASNISVVGGLISLSTFTGLLGQGQPKFIRATGYAVLDFAFPFIAALAPLVYNFSRTVQVKSNSAGDTTILSEGSVRMFIVAGIFTIWACTGQLLVQGLWLIELDAAHSVPAGFGICTAIVFLFVSIGMLVYASRTMIGTIDVQTADPVSTQRANGVSLRARAVRLNHSESWPLL
jgi:hypothetical protein